VSSVDRVAVRCIDDNAVYFVHRYGKESRSILIKNAIHDFLALNDTCKLCGRQLFSVHLVCSCKLMCKITSIKNKCTGVDRQLLDSNFSLPNALCQSPNSHCASRPVLRFTGQNAQNSLLAGALTLMDSLQC